MTKRRPPLWLLAGSLASLWAGAHAIAVWIFLFLAMPVHEDVRMIYVAAQAGVRYGWSTIYDPSTLRALSASFPPGQQRIDAVYTYVHPPLVAWLFAPLTVLSEPAAYLAWTLISLVALVFAWHLAAPFAGLAKASLLLLSIGLWPVLSAFYYGQPIMVVLACVAGCWWLIKHERPLAAGLVLAIATSLKPQVMWMLPAAILASGRVRAVTGWVAGVIALALLSAAALGPSGVTSWVHAIQQNQSDPAHSVSTLIHFFGIGPMTIALWAIFSLVTLAVAYTRRQDLDAVFAAGLIGTALVTFHFHELDYSVLAIAAWFFLRTSPPLWQRLWLIAGIGAVELLAVGTALGPDWDVPSHAVVIAWTATWLVALVPRRVFLHAEDAQEKAREDRLHA